MDQWREQEHRRRTANRTKKVRAFAVAAAIGLAAVACTPAARNGRSATAPTGQPPTVNPADAAVEEVASSFLEVYGAFDVDQAITYLADDADISGLTGSLGSQGEKGTREELRLLVSFLEGTGYKQTLDSCVELGSSPTGTTLRCTFAYHLLRSDEIGRGPFSGGSFLLTVRDGQIVRASVSWAYEEEFSPQMWEPFASWVSTAYPKDFAVMYEYNGVELTEKSIRLWEQHTQEYVEEVGS